MGSPHKCPNHGSVTEENSDFAVMVLFADNMLFNPIPRATAGKFGSLRGSRVLWLHFFVWNTDHQTGDSHSRTPTLCPCPSLLVGSALPPAGVPMETLSSSSTKKAASSPLRAKPTASSQLQICVCSQFEISTFLASHVCSCLPTFRYINVWISQACL